MKKLSYLGFMLVFALGLFMTSCSKDSELTTSQTDPEVDVNVTNVGNNLVNRSVTDGNGLQLDCITILYPFSLIDEAGNEYPVASDEDFESLLSDSTLVNTIVDFVYPLTIELEDESQVSVADALELGDLFALCVPSGGWDEDDFPAYLIDASNSCYTMAFPVNLEDTNGNTVVANDESEFIEFVSQDLLFFVFPFDLITEEGNIVTAYDVDGLFTLLIGCNGFEQDSVWDWSNDFEYLGCYIVEFPMDVVLQDGSVVTVNNHMELCDLMLEGEIVSYAFPLELTDEEGNVIVVNSQDELNELLDDCYGDTWVGDGDIFLLIFGSIDSTGMEGCYSINFPISAESIDENGNINVVQFNSVDEIINSNSPILNVVWPVTVTLAADGTEVELNSLEDQLDLLNDCN